MQLICPQWPAKSIRARTEIFTGGSRLLHLSMITSTKSAFPVPDKQRNRSNLGLEFPSIAKLAETSYLMEATVFRQKKRNC